MKAKRVIYFILCIVIILSQSSCINNSNSNLSEISSVDKTAETNNSSESNSIYKYINGYAAFSYSFKDGYVICSAEDTTYSPMVRWTDEEGQGTIVSACQVISADGKEIYNKSLEIINGKDENEGNHIWDYRAVFEPSVKAKCSENAKVECYIKMTDSNEIEYHVMLIPVEKYNNDNYAGSSVYIIDKNNDKEFWYDDLY